MANANAKINNSGYGGDLAYPEDVGNMDRTGHYVQFFINVQESAQVQFAAGDFNATPTGGGSTVQSEPSTLGTRRAPTKRLAGSIQLYMPNQLSVGHTATYQEEEIGAAITGAQNIGNKLATGNWSLWGAVKSVGRGIANATTSAVSSLPGQTGARAAADIARGQITNNRTEMKFEGIDRRSFSFSFKMTPKSKQESENIKNIVNLFRFHAMPEFLGGRGSRTMIAPSTFDIKYMHKGGEHTFMNKISTCLLESVTVNYGGDRTQFFDNNAPVVTEISLTFKELELITKERIAEGY